MLNSGPYCVASLVWGMNTHCWIVFNQTWGVHAPNNQGNSVTTGTEHSYNDTRICPSPENLECPSGKATLGIGSCR